ncbi:MAG: hypothetical protein V1869_03980 [Candidatus Omnitrophota bacterium]
MKGSQALNKPKDKIPDSKIRVFVFTLCILGFLPVIAQAEIADSSWQVNKSQHFIIYYRGAQPSLVNDLASKAEAYYNGILEELGYRRFVFWNWDNRAKIYLYDDAQAFQRDTGHSLWAGAIVSVNGRRIKTYIGQSGFLDSILPHEMTHIIFREFIGLNTPLPLWIDEGVASSQEKSYLNSRLQIARQLIAQNKYYDIGALSGLSRPDEDIAPDVFYSEAASLIVFLIRQKGRDSFLDFSRLLRDGADWRKALLRAFNFSSFQELEAEWKDFMLKQG